MENNTVKNNYTLHLSKPHEQDGEMPQNNWVLYSQDDVNAYLQGDLSIGVNTPHDSAKLHVDSTTKGFLPPRLVADPVNPTAGLMYFNSTYNIMKYYNGTIWVSF